MDLSLPRFSTLCDGVLPKTEPWPVTEKSPASPVSARDGNRTRTPSPCFELDDISSASSVGDTSTNDYKLTLSSDTEDSVTPVGSLVISSEEDVPLSSGQEDRRKVRKRDPRPRGQPRPTDAVEYVPTPGERPVDVPVYKPTPRERPVDDPTLRVGPEPTLRERPLDDRTFDPTPRVRPVDNPMLRERPVDVLMYKPTPRERPVVEKPYGPRPRERPVDDPTLKCRPVNVLAYEPTPRERPVNDQAYEPMPEGRPFTEPTLRERPVEDQAYEPMPEGRPLAEPTPRKRPVDYPTLRERPVDDPKSGPMTGGGPADGPKTEPRPNERPVDPKTLPVMYKPPPPSDLPEWSDSEVMPLIIIENNSGVANPRTTDGRSPVSHDILLLQSPEMTSLEDQGALSAPLSPNRARKGHSQDMPAEGSIFDVSPDVPGFNMRPAVGGDQRTVTAQPSPSNYVGFNPFFGAPIAFAQFPGTSGMDTTTTVPIYDIPKDSSIGIDQSAVPTVFASGVSPDSIPWSTAVDIIRDIVREGPFDVDATPMETEDSPLINTSMPGCPYRMTSYTGTALVDADTTYGLQLHHPRFLEFIGAPESARLLNNSPSFWVDRLGQERAMAAAVNLQRDAGFMMSNLQILEQFVMSLHRMSAEMLSIGVDHVVFPVEEVDKLSVMPRALRAAKYMTAMGLWRTTSGSGASGPLPTSTCPSCMNCEYCFGRKEPSAQ